MCALNKYVPQQYCNVCKTWIHRKCAHLPAVEFEYLSPIEDELFCMKCISNTFPFNNISEDELNYLSLGIEDNVADLYDNCSKLKFEPFKFTDKADPDNNFYQHLSTNSLYYTEEQFKQKFAKSKEETANFSIIHFNCRSLPSNYNKLKLQHYSFRFALWCYCSIGDLADW